MSEERVMRTPDVNMVIPLFPYTWFSFRGFFGNIGNFFKSFKSWFRRARRGYATYDVWECGENIVNYMILMLTEYRNMVCSYPDYMFSSYDEYIAYIDTIIDKLTYGIKEPSELNKYTDSFWAAFKKPEDKRSEMDQFKIALYRKTNDEIVEAQQKALEEGFSMFAKIQRDLWV